MTSAAPLTLHVDRVSPFTYWIGGIVATELHGRTVTCSERETNVFDPPPQMSCGQYLASLASKLPGDLPGVLQNPDATSDCRYCPLKVADQFLAPSRIFWSDRWRNYGIVCKSLLRVPCWSL